MARRALITGVGGFVGAHLADVARADATEVIGLDRAGVSQPVDLLDGPAVQRLIEGHRPEVVIHLAGLLKADDPAKLYEANVIGTLRLLEALAKTGLRPRLVVASSSAVYGEAGGIINEDAPLRPRSHYGISKVAQELEALREHLTEGLDVVVARTFNIVGPGQPASLAAGSFARQIAIAEAAGGGKLVVGDLSASRDFVDVRDAARALWALALKGRAGRSYNVCTGIARPTQACVDALVSCARALIEVRREVRSSGAADVRGQVGNSQRLQSDTGWSAHIPFEQSMQDLLDWWRYKIQPSSAGVT